MILRTTKYHRKVPGGLSILLLKDGVVSGTYSVEIVEE